MNTPFSSSHTGVDSKKDVENQVPAMPLLSLQPVKMYRQEVLNSRLPYVFLSHIYIKRKRGLDTPCRFPEEKSSQLCMRGGKRNLVYVKGLESLSTERERSLDFRVECAVIFLNCGDS